MVVPSRRVTGDDVARLAGVSRTTVSFVLNNNAAANISAQTRQRVLEAAEALGYVPNAAAQALAGHRTKIVGLVFPETHPHLSSHLFLLQILEGLMEVVQEHGLRLLLDSLGGNGHREAYLGLARAKRIDGLIIIDPNVDDPALQTLAEEGFPLVLIGRTPGLNVSSVDVDNCAAAQAAVAHLIAQGHTRIGCITNSPLSGMAAQERLRGYRDALKLAGLLFNDDLVQYGEYTPESGYDAMCALLSKDSGLSAVFVAGDVVAFGALRAIEERGLQTPQDVAVVGFDDVPLARFSSPPLTTIRLSAAEQGRQAGELLLDMIRDNAQDCRQVLLETELIVRASSVAAS